MNEKKHKVIDFIEVNYLNLCSYIVISLLLSIIVYDLGCDIFPPITWVFIPLLILIIISIVQKVSNWWFYSSLELVISTIITTISLKIILKTDKVYTFLKNHSEGVILIVHFSVF